MYVGHLYRDTCLEGGGVLRHHSLFFTFTWGLCSSSAHQAEALAGPSGFHFSCVLCVCSNGKNKCRTLLLSKKTWNRHNFNEIIKSSDFLEVLSHSMWHWLMWLLLALYGSLSGMLHLKPFHQSNRWEQKYVWWLDKVIFFPTFTANHDNLLKSIIIFFMNLLGYCVTSKFYRSHKSYIN